MKKFLVVILCLFALCGCTSKPVTDVGIDMGVQPEEITGGWTINEDMPVMNDAIFDKAVKNYRHGTLEPLQLLGTQIVAGINYVYLAYGVDDNGIKGLRIVKVYEDLEGNSEIIAVSDFDVSKFATEEYAASITNTGSDPGSYVVNAELPDFLSDELNASFEKAFEGFAGVGYKPVCVLATQVVAGMNHAILATGTTVTPEAPVNLYVVTMYVDLNSNAAISNICGFDFDIVMTGVE